MSQTIPKRRNNFVRFLGYVRPYKWQVVAASVGGIVKFSVPLLVPQVTRYLLDGAPTPDEVQTALAGAQMVT